MFPLPSWISYEITLRYGLSVRVDRDKDVNKSSFYFILHITNNKARHVVHTIVSPPNPKQYVMIHTSVWYWL